MKAKHYTHVIVHENRAISATKTKKEAREIASGLRVKGWPMFVFSIVDYIKFIDPAYVVPNAQGVQQ